MISQSAVAPLISIVMPVLNREIEVVRAIQSCLVQEFQDFEIIVVDDCSSDSTYRVVEEFPDSRVRAHRHSTNKGDVASRRTGVDVSRGHWVLTLDSDDELLPGALGLIAGAIESAPPEVSRLGFCYRTDWGGISPFPAPRAGVVDYGGFLRFLDAAQRTDALWVTRRETFGYPFGHWAVGLVHYHLDFAKCFLTAFCPETVALIHTDAPVRQSHFLSRGSTEVTARRARLDVEVISGALKDHCSELRQHAPRYYAGLLRHMALAESKVNGRSSAVRHAWEHCRLFPSNVKGWVLLGLVGIGGWVPNIGHRVYERWRRERRHGTPA